MKIYKVRVTWDENSPLHYWFSTQNKAQQFAAAFIKDYRKSEVDDPYISIIVEEMDKPTIELPMNRSIWNFKQGK